MSAREIEFRARRAKDGEFKYGYYLKSVSNGDHKIHHYSTLVDRMVTSVVDPRTLGQYTGIKDANGVKVFEGDVLRGDGPPFFDIDKNPKAVLVVEFCCLHACFMVKKHSLSSREYMPNPWGLSGGIGKLSVLVGCGSKVIGNIHQHPELLEVSK